MPEVKQTEFDWTWAERRDWITEAELPAGRAADGRPVSGRSMAGVLNAINDHLGNNCEAWPSQTTIAAKLHCSEKTVKRACDALQELSLLIVIPKPCSKGTRNHYRIVWSELQLLQPDRREAWNYVLRQRRNQVDSSGLQSAPDTFGGQRFAQKSAHETSLRASDTRAKHRTPCPGASDTLTEASDTVSDELQRELQKEDHHLSSDTFDDVSAATRSRSPLTVGEVVVIFVRLGVRTAATLVDEALDAGCDTRSLAAIARWFERSQRANPHKWRKASAVLYVRLKNALPGVRAWEGWPDGLARPKAKPKSVSDYQRERAAARDAFKREGLSMAEMFRQGYNVGE